MDCPPGQKSGHCRKMAVSGGSTIVIYFSRLLIPGVFFLHECTMKILPEEKKVIH